MSTSLLILTVGTGTAGRTSNIVAGLQSTIRLLAPRAFWLVPSTDEVSRLVADEVRSGFETFVSFNAEQAYLELPHPDDLEACRRDLRHIIRQVAQQCRPDERLIFNPTSGTKQMTAAAVLAALDEGLGHIVFTIGERQDGVVKTGTEKLTYFDPISFFRERDLTQAREAIKHGAFGSAERLLRPHSHNLPQAYATAECLLAWSRQDYATAAAAASRFNEKLRQELLTLSQDAGGDSPSPAILADLLAWADHHRRLNEADTALLLAYKALEFAAKLRLREKVGNLPPYKLADIAAWPIGEKLKNQLHKGAAKGPIFLGLSQAMRCLEEMGDALGRDFQSDQRYRWAAQTRNEQTHTIAPAKLDDAQRLLDLTRKLLETHIKLPTPIPRPSI